MADRNLQLDEGAHKKLKLLSEMSNEPMRDIVARMIDREFVVAFGDVDPERVTIQRRPVVAEGE